MKAKESKPVFLTASHTRDALGNTLTVSNRWNATTVSAFAYGYDALNRRTSRLDNGTALNTFAYNARGELTNACVAAASLPSVYEYWHDAIGNTVLGTEGGDTASCYSFNGLNQPEYCTVDAYYYGHPNPFFAWWENWSDIYPTHDPDGNMTYDGTFRYTWDAENRLIAVSNATGTAFVSSYTYDHLGRRITKSCFGTTYTFTYDGWNLIADSSNTRYVWGLDLSGTMQGAGGVGGLAAVIQGNVPHIPCYDANGNVTEYVNGNNGSIAARYRYDAYGNTLAQSGPMASGMTQRFSTKYYDGEYLGTDMYRYEQRVYAPRFHRWLSTDPIGERGGLNLYGFCGNDPINRWDYLGMWTLNFTQGVLNFGAGWTPELKKSFQDVFDTLKKDAPKMIASAEEWLAAIDGLSCCPRHKEYLKEQMTKLKQYLVNVKKGLDSEDSLTIKLANLGIDTNAQTCTPFGKFRGTIEFNNNNQNKCHSWDNATLSNSIFHELLHVAGVPNDKGPPWVDNAYNNDNIPVNPSRIVISSLLAEAREKFGECKEMFKLNPKHNKEEP